MATASRPSPRPYSLIVVVVATVLFFTTTAVAEIRFTEIRPVDWSTIPIDSSTIYFDWFSFTHSGSVDLNVSQISFSFPNPKPNPNPDLSQVGFFLCTPDSWHDFLSQNSLDNIACPLQSHLINHVFTFDKLQNTDRYDTTFIVSDANQFSLFFCNCVPNSNVSMNVRSSMYNLDPKTGRRDYLPAGKTNLPWIYFLFFLVYSSLAVTWTYVLYRNLLMVSRIHFFMLAVVILKAFNLLCEALYKSYIQRTGNAHGWDVLFYISSFMKEITVFTLIVLIGTGWSFLKHYLQAKEKMVLMIVIPLQVIANVAQVVIDQTGPFGQDLYTWKKVLLFADDICCCAVFFPIVWSIKNLRDAARNDEKAAVNLKKLGFLFKLYFVVVICYLYFTRTAAYALETVTSYQYRWTSVVVPEFVTIACYIFSGYNFGPKVRNSYFALDDEDEEAAAEA